MQRGAGAPLSCAHYLKCMLYNIMTPEHHPPQTILGQFRRPTFWVTAVIYVLLTIGLRYFVFTPLFRAFVEQNSGGFLSGYFSNYAGYDVVGSVVGAISVNIFLYQQAIAVLVALALWRRHKAVAMGILIVILTFVVMFLCFVLIFILTARRR